jgi:hypothetical protein
VKLPSHAPRRIVAAAISRTVILGSVALAMAGCAAAAGSPPPRGLTQRRVLHPWQERNDRGQRRQAAPDEERDAHAEHLGENAGRKDEPQGDAVTIQDLPD